MTPFMTKISIKNSNLDLIEFVEENIMGLRGKKIHFSSSVFNDLYKKCEDEKGYVYTQVPTRFRGILVYSLVFPAPENNKSKGNTLVSFIDRGYNERMKRYVLLEIKSKQFSYKKPKPLLSPSAYIHNGELEKEFGR